MIDIFERALVVLADFSVAGLALVGLAAIAASIEAGLEEHGR